MIGRLGIWFCLCMAMTAAAVPPGAMAAGEESADEARELIGVEPAPGGPDWTAWRLEQKQKLAEVLKPQGPPEDYEGNPVDWFIERWHRDNGIEPGGQSADTIFARRAYLDLIGLPPTPAELKAYAEDDSPNKRAGLIDSLLARDRDYAEHWMTFWNDLLRNNEQTNIDNLRGTITRWLYESLKTNKPYDVMVAQLLNPSEEGAIGFLKGINWRGRINASQRPVIQAAQNVGQVFMATTLKCASCHDHFLKPWTLEDTYGLAAMFSKDKLEIYRCDKKTGDVAGASFPLQGFGQVDPDADLFERRQAAAELVTHPKNPRFAKTMVNRLWHKLIGRGLFEPIDDLDAQVFYPELLDWLAYEFMESGYDIKGALRLIATSDTYAMASDSENMGHEVPEYANLSPRRLTSEQFLDSIYAVTGYYPSFEEPEKALYRVEVDNCNVRTWRHRTPGKTAIALGRPNREQVVSARDHEATVIQMLELVNGNDLASLLGDAAGHMLETGRFCPDNTEAFVESIFLQAYGRQPNETETAIAREMLSGETDEALRANLEDFLWIVCMNPEFQFIH